MAALAALLVTAAVSDARADDVAMAEKLFLEGRRLMEAGSYPAACDKFKAAHDLDTTATGTLLNLALCHEQIKKNATAWAEFRQVIAESTGRREDRVAMARAHETLLAPQLSVLVVQVPAASRAPGLKVEIDKRSIAEASWGIELPVDPGKHVVDVSAPGKVSRSLDVVVGDVSDHKSVDVPPLADAPATPPPRAVVATSDPGATQRTVGYALGGAGIVALSAGLISGAIAMSRSSDADTAAGRCPDNRCASDTDRRHVVDAISDANKYANVANVAVGAAVALLVGGVVLIVTAKSEPAKSALSTLRVGADREAMSFGRSW